ncbi:helix-turn-helix transcriptional regulator [Brevundimonas aurantiaca]|uniref:helix-turn-helix domain-containing protein n=1 Tax=Brevundimonas aurantiaca TaxID=74316 RepID=UPI002FDCE567
MVTGEAKQLRDLLARNVRRLRRDQNMSQEALADAAGLHRTYVGSIERSERNVSLDSLCALAHGLSTEVWCLLSDSKEGQSPQ